MQPIKVPNWIKWIINPKYCLAVLRLKTQREMRTPEGRKKMFRRLYVLIKRNALLASVILLTFQITNERKWRREAENSKYQSTIKKDSIISYYKRENNFIRGVISMRNSDFQNFPRPWWEKIKRGPYWRFIDLNPKYENDFGFKKTESLGKSNVEFFGPKIGNQYGKGDYKVWLSPNHELYDIEPDPNIENGGVFVYKYGRLSIVSDSISSGMSFELKKIIEAFERKGYKIEKVEPEVTGTD